MSFINVFVRNIKRNIKNNISKYMLNSISSRKKNVGVRNLIIYAISLTLFFGTLRVTKSISSCVFFYYIIGT